MNKNDEWVIPPITTGASRQIAVLRTLLMAGIIVIHTPLTVAPDWSQGINASVQRLFSLILAESFVPAFFVLSGYLMLNRYDGTWSGYRGFLARKARGLLVPYLLWNILVFLFYLCAPRIPGLAAGFTGTKITADSAWAILNQLLGVTRPPIAYQFWFIRDLMIWTALMPLFAWLLRRIPITTGISLLLWATVPLTGGFNCEIFYIFSGMLLRRYAIVEKSPGRAEVAAWDFIFAGLTCWRLSGAGIPATAHFAGILGGIPVCFQIASRLAAIPKLEQRFVEWGNAVFFIFAAHGLLIVLLRKSYERLTGGALDLTGYILCPVICWCILYAIFVLLKRWTPRMLGLLCGGRI